MKLFQVLTLTAAALLLVACSDGGMQNSSVDSANTSSNSEISNESLLDKPTGSVELLTVAPQQVSCTGMFETQCLLVRSKTSEDWTYFYDPIEGFEYRSGYYWLLEVEKTPIANPPADASSIRTELIRVREMTPAHEVSNEADFPTVDVETSGTGEETDEFSSTTTSESIIEELEIAGTRGNCQSFSGETFPCLRLRALGEQQWSNWPGEIEGYEHQPNIATTLQVRRIAWEGEAPMDDAPEFRRVLIKVLSSQSA